VTSNTKPNDWLDWLNATTSAMLESIPGEIIAKAAAMLPDAASASDEPQYVEVRHGGHWIRIAFRRFMYTRGKMTRWVWTAASAEKPPR
jgi:hypothetical protein